MSKVTHQLDTPLLTGGEEVRARRARSTLRRAEALQLRLRGLTYAAIGAALGVSKKHAHTLVTGELARSAERARESSDQLRQIDLARTEALIVAVWERATSPECAVVSVPADNEDGCKAYDGQDKAIDRVTKLLERRAKLMGLDTPVVQKLEHTGAGGLPLGLPPALAMLAPPATLDEVQHYVALGADACVVPECRVHAGAALLLPPGGAP